MNNKQLTNFDCHAHARVYVLIIGHCIYCVVHFSYERERELLHMSVSVSVCVRGE